MQKKKSLGQHFLNSPHYVQLIADALEIKKGETVLEIGPGEGALTEELLKRGAHVVALEKDSRLIEGLRAKFQKNFAVLEGDALLFDTSQLSNYKVVGNIPYYITGALFKKFLTTPVQPKRLVFLVQKEVAERIARSKKESILSLSIKVYGTPKYIKTVPSGAFVPAPKVDSAILLIENISRKHLKNAAHEAKFFELVKKGFGKKRKQLKNNLKIDLGSVQVSPQARAEDLSLNNWLDLAAK
ncbi:16S rRNA (adenine(1518)-N(6)/adenine(1519)-N(6))-dimethyltransferase RsmA [Candidatus Parcubacteria bacterium]|nr:16S rRNA (adenine(1518)-N(6)/adenine(1519)-N(6))-dimethyltransferase RsmA [Candidatus Parcubacteria bacterium]